MKLYIVFLFLGINILANAQVEIVWGTAVNVAPSSNDNLHPRLALDGSGNPLVLWGKSSNQAMFSRWSGSAFTAAVPLNPMDIPVFTASWAGPDLAANGDTVYAIFKQTPEDEGSMYMVSSTDGGMNWSEEVQVENIGDSLSRFPTLAIDGEGNPMVAFMKFNSAFGDAQWVVTRSNDLGQTFVPDVPASGFGNATVCDCCPGSIVASGNQAALLYRNNASNIRDTWAAISTDNGASFPDAVNVDQENWMLMSCPSSGPDGIILGDTLYSVFMNGATGTSFVYLSKTSLMDVSSDGGVALTGDFPGMSNQNFIRIAHSGNAAVSVWKQTVNSQSQLALLYTNDITNGWPNEYVVPVPMHVVNMDVAMSDNNIYLVWQDDNSGTVRYMKGVVSEPTALNSASSEQHLNIYPNPFSSNLNVSVPSTMNVLLTLEVRDAMGKTVLTLENISNHKQIDLSALSPGIYMLTTLTETTHYSERIIKRD